MSYLYPIAGVVLALTCILALRRERYTIASVLGVTLIAIALFEVTRLNSP